MPTWHKVKIMAMERLTITMTTEDIDLFERYRADMNMSKSAFIRLLVAEHFEHIPAFLQHKELIGTLSSLNNSLKEIVLSEKLSDAEITHLREKIQIVNEVCANLAQTSSDMEDIGEIVKKTPDD